MTTWFSVSEGRLRVVVDHPEFDWEGLVDGLPVLDLVTMPSGGSVVVLLDPPVGHKAVRNLVKVGSDACVLWRADPGAGGDVFVSIELDGHGAIAASTWSGYLVMISPKTGASLGKMFTK